MEPAAGCQCCSYDASGPQRVGSELVFAVGLRAGWRYPRPDPLVRRGIVERTMEWAGRSGPGKTAVDSASVPQLRRILGSKAWAVRRRLATALLRPGGFFFNWIPISDLLPSIQLGLRCGPSAQSGTWALGQTSGLFRLRGTTEPATTRAARRLRKATFSVRPLR